MFGCVVTGEFEEDLTAEPQEHVPVMCSEVVRYLDPQPGMIYVDGTLGLAGHADAILARIGSTGKMIGIDRDALALARAGERLKKYQGQCQFFHDNYRNIDEVLRQAGVSRVDYLLLDLGISSFQLDDPQRGFSLRVDGPLDMRMDQDGQISAYDLINSLSENEIDTILRDFGEERWHHRIARRIVAARAQRPIETTNELKHVVMTAMPHGRSYTKIHPATRTFQAFRIAVNNELDSLQVALDSCIALLNPGGRIAVIAFHSLEDRIVKLAFRDAVKMGIAEYILKKPLQPIDEEIKKNPRARSARLRVIERI